MTETVITRLASFPAEGFRAMNIVNQESKAPVSRLERFSGRGPRPGYAGRNVILFSVLCVIVVFVFCILFITPRYQTNDDVGIMLIVSGKVLANAPDHHALFINVLLARLLVYLYESNAHVPWYGYMHIATLFASLLGVTYASFLTGLHPLGILYWLVCVITCFLPSISQMQYTVTSFFAGQAGFFVLYAAMSRPERTEHRITLVLECLSAVGLLLASLLIRQKSFGLACVVSIPLMLWLTYRQWRLGRLGKWLVWCAGVCALIVAVGAYDLNCYLKDPESHEWMKLHILKEHFVPPDYATLNYDDNTKRIFDQVGWSENDFRMIRIWGYVDPNVFPVSKFETVVSQFGIGSHSYGFYLKRMADRLSRRLDRRTLLLSLVFLSGLLVLIARSQSILVSVATALFTTLCVALLAALWRLPPRVYFPCLGYVCWSVLIFMDHDGVRLNVGLAKKVCLAVGLVGLLVAMIVGVKEQVLGMCWESSSTARALNRQLRECVKNLAPDQGKLFVVVGGAFPYEHVLPLEDTEYLGALKIIALGAMNRSLISKRMLSSNGVADIFQTMLERDNVFVLLDPKRHAPVLQAYIAEHYRIPVTMVRVNIPACRPLYQLRPVENPGVNRKGTPSDESGSLSP